MAADNWEDLYLIVIIVIVLWQDCTLTRDAGDSDMQIFELQTDSHIIQINYWWWDRWWHPFNATIKSLWLFKKFYIIILNVKKGEIRYSIEKEHKVKILHNKVRASGQITTKNWQINRNIDHKWKFYGFCWWVGFWTKIYLGAGTVWVDIGRVTSYLLYYLLFKEFTFNETILVYTILMNF